MNRRSVELGFILKQIPNYDFSMNTFRDRLRLQKTIYLLQVFDVCLGYDFLWYLRGPYCSILTTNGFLLQDVYGDIPGHGQVKFKNKDAQRGFERFLRFVVEKNTDDLEIASLLHYLKRACALPDDAIKEKVVKKRPDFTTIRVDNMWKEMKKWRII